MVISFADAAFLEFPFNAHLYTQIRRTADDDRADAL